MARYDMPALFGPSLMPDQSRVALAEAVIIPFETTADAAARLLPRFFELTERPIVTVSRIDYHDVDYLGGRGYREVVISVGAVYTGPGPRMEAAFAPVMWVSEVAALIGGREYMGFGKLPGEMGPMFASDTRRAFRCAEYGNTLLEGEADALRPLTDEALAKVNRGAAEVNTFGWKFIPGCGGEADVDYPLVNSMRWRYERAWSGAGRLTLHCPDAKAAPMSSRVMAALAQIPVKEYRRAFVGEGSAIIDRSATRKLQVSA